MSMKLLAIVAAAFCCVLLLSIARGQGTWEYLLQPIGQGTKLTVTENGEVDNALFRFVPRIVNIIKTDSGDT